MLLLQTITLAVALWASIAYVIGLMRAIIPKQTYMEHWFYNPIAIFAWSLFYYLIHR